jgi:hypothetical protein
MVGQDGGKPFLQESDAVAAFKARMNPEDEGG